MDQSQEPAKSKQTEYQKKGLSVLGPKILEYSQKTLTMNQ